MLDTSLVLAVAALIGGIAARAPWPAAVAALGLFAIARTKLSRPQLVIAPLLLGLGTWRASCALDHYEQDRLRARDELGPPAQCVGTVEVVSSPLRLGDRMSMLVDAIRLECDGDARVAPGTTLRVYGPIGELARGDTCELIVKLGTVEVPRNFEVDGAWVLATQRGAQLSGGVVDIVVVSRDTTRLEAWIDRARNHARRRIEASYPSDAAPMARALVLGENDLPQEDAEAFRISGLSHLLAVSGTHVVLAVLGAVRLVEGMLRRWETASARFDVGRLAAAWGVPLAWAYAEFAGSGGSVRRAALMTSVALMARAAGRVSNPTRAVGLSLLLCALVDPLAAFDVSLGLSAAATAGLMLLSRPLQAKLERLPTPLGWIAAPIAATLSATLMCLPWLAVLGNNVSLVGVAANVVAVPIGEAVSLPACLAHLFASPLPHVERGIALLASGSLIAVRAIARWGAACDVLTIPVPRPTEWQLVALALTAPALLLRPQAQRWTIAALGVLTWLVLEALAFEAGHPKGLLRITFLDVGQGDSMIVDFPDGRCMLIDGGGVVGSPVDPGVRVVAPTLRARRRSSVDLAVLSHPHPDHFMGLASTLPGVRIGRFWDTGQGEREGAGPLYASLLHDVRSRRIPIHRPSELCGKAGSIGGATLRVLGPCPVVEGVSANDNSFVFHVRYGKHAALLVGDAEMHQEKRLLALGRAALRADLLKIGHHGSRTSSSSAFLDAVHPSIAVVTSGVRNRYGHPSSETLGALRERRVRVLRSDRHGAIEWETDGNTAAVKTRLSGQ